MRDSDASQSCQIKTIKTRQFQQDYLQFFMISFPRSSIQKLIMFEMQTKNRLKFYSLKIVCSYMSALHECLFCKRFVQKEEK